MRRKALKTTGRGSRRSAVSSRRGRRAFITFMDAQLERDSLRLASMLRKVLDDVDTLTGLSFLLHLNCITLTPGQR